MPDASFKLILMLGLPVGIPAILLYEIWCQKISRKPRPDIDPLLTWLNIVWVAGMGTSLLILALAVVGLTRLVFGV
jgi:hypothetical protein